MARYPHHYNYVRSLSPAITPTPTNRTRHRLTATPELIAAPRHNWRRFQLLLFCFALLTFGVHVGWNKHVSAQATAAQQAQQLALASAGAKAAIFKVQLAALQAANPLVDVGVAVASNQLGVERLGASNVYSAASVGKLITAANFLHLVDAKRASLNQQIDGKTTRYWLNMMLVKSDDIAWQNLNAYLTHAGLTSYATSIGLTQYDAETDNFPAVDAAILLKKLHDGTLLSPTSQQLMLNWLATANYRGYIVPAAPAGSTVYHKVGFDGDNLHDAAIIESGQRSFVLVIFTDGHGSYDWGARTKLIQAITRDATAAYL